MTYYEIAMRLGVAALAGLAVGIEREWSARNAADHALFGGVRTFLLLGLVGGLGSIASELIAPAVGLLLLAAAALLVVVGYLVTALRNQVDATTEVAALAVLGAGALAGAGRLTVASGLAAVCALVLAEKTRLHAFVHGIELREIRAGLHFAVLALVVLPLLPEGPFGPAPGIRPRELWALVLLFAGLSFAGFLALRLAGPGRGWGIAGLLGGLVSSTAVTFGFSRESRDSSERFGRALAFGVLAACAVLPFRVLILATALEPQLGRALALPIAPCALVGVGAVVLMLRRGDRGEPGEAQLPGNPLRLGAAIQMTLLFQAVLYLLSWVTDWLGHQGVTATAFLLGLTDLDALTFSMTQLVKQDRLVAEVGARALIVGVVANTLFKTSLVLALGRGSFRKWTAGGLGLFAAALLGGLLLVGSA